MSHPRPEPHHNCHLHNIAVCVKTNIFEWNKKRILNKIKNKIFFNETKKYFSAELWPVCQTGNSEETDAKTREFLRQVSCDWWRAGHVTTPCSPLIGAGGGDPAGPHHRPERQVHQDTRLPQPRAAQGGDRLRHPRGASQPGPAARGLQGHPQVPSQNR